MNSVTVELWLWLGKELKGDFESPSEMRSVRNEVVEEGTNIGQLLNNLANRYDPFGQKVFDIREKRLHPHVVLTYNDHVISPHNLYEQVLKEGDKITIMPLYTGG
jgi:molybdopterin converting factor small subunit